MHHFMNLAWIDVKMNQKIREESQSYGHMTFSTKGWGSGALWKMPIPVSRVSDMMGQGRFD